MSKKRALITGITGQDGSYLADFLLNKDYDVFGLIRRSSTDPLIRIQDLVTNRGLKLISGNMRDSSTLRRALEISLPDEIYNLAALSDVGISFQCPEETLEVNYFGFGKLVEEALRINPGVKIYQASTSEMFGKTKPPQNESSEFLPVSPYGEAKLKSHQLSSEYRKNRGAFVCCGILFNHESPKRGKHFVTRKITYSLAKIKLGLQDVLELGNLDAKRDWGFAGDYVEAMWLMLQQNTPDDYVIASGESHSVRDFVNAAAKALDINIFWEGGGLEEVGRDEGGKVIVKVNKDFYRPVEVDDLRGDYAKANEKLGWEPRTNFQELVKMMVDHDIKIVSQDLTQENNIRN